jgi:hypothetical protein
LPLPEGVQDAVTARIISIATDRIDDRQNRMIAFRQNGVMVMPELVGHVLQCVVEI